MFDLTKLSCLFVDAMYLYTLKVRVGVECRRDLLWDNAVRAYNYLQLATKYNNGECTIPPKIFRQIMEHQNFNNSLTIETCC